MAHIADHHNNGRCAQLRTIDNARGAYAQLINKEIRVAQSTHQKRIISSMNIRCPRCALPVSSVRCPNCCYFPIAMPTNDEIDSAERQLPLSVRRYTPADTPEPDSSKDIQDRVKRLEALVKHENEESKAMIERVNRLITIAEQSNNAKRKR